MTDLAALSARTGRSVNNIDAVFVAASADPAPHDLTPADGLDHARVVRANAHRVDVRVWTVPGGILMLGRGVAGRWEIAVEVDESARGQGLGRTLFSAGLGLIPPGERLWAQVAPGNAASMRAILAAGFHPIGAEALLIPPT